MDLDKGTVALFLGILFGGVILWALLRKSSGGSQVINNPGEAPCNVGFWGVNVPCKRLDFYRDKVLGFVEEIPTFVKSATKTTTDFVYDKSEQIDDLGNKIDSNLNLGAKIPVVGTNIDILTNPIKTKDAIFHTVDKVFGWA